MTDIADLVAKLDAWQRECAMLRVEPKGITTRELTELRRIVVAAERSVRAEVDFAKNPSIEAHALMLETRAGLVLAVRGEA